MPLTRHVKRHFTPGETVRDIVSGMSDGLTVVRALKERPEARPRSRGPTSLEG